MTAHRFARRASAGSAVVGAVAAFASLVAACDAPSSHVDGSDLHGVFERDGAAPSGAPSGSAAASGSAAPARKAGPFDAGAPRLPELERKPVAGPCVRLAEGGARRPPPEAAGRPAGRPACRGSRVLEWREASGAPRYGCVAEPPDLAKRTPLPLLVFFHGELDTPRALAQKTDLGDRAGKVDLTNDPRRLGYVVLALQGRHLNGAVRFDTEDVSGSNADIVATDHFVDVLRTEGVVDPRRIYALGDSAGGRMAALYAMVRTDRVAAFATYGADASSLEWTCAEPATPAMIVYRACDGVLPCERVEQWLDARLAAGAPTGSLRLDDGRGDEPSCIIGRRCKGTRAESNHHRWPKERELDILEFLGRYSLEVAP